MTRPTLLLLCALLLIFALPLTALAQRPSDPTPIPIAPGQPLFTPVPTLDLNVCRQPLPVQIGQTIFVKPGVNIRSQPSESSAIVWNTSFNNVDERGRPNQRQVNMPARVVGGPVCSGALNWWQIVGLGAPGWVAEGRPERDGFLIIVPGAQGVEGCLSRFTIRAGTTVDLLLNARVRSEPDERGLVLTVAPAGTPVEVLRGGECVGGLIWWFVRVTVVGVRYEGWMAEGDGRQFWLVPRDLPNEADGTLCGPPLTLSAGQRARVSTGGVGRAIALRSAPALDAPLLFSLVDNVPLIVEGGPVCSGNLNWWRVSILASEPVVGWMAEGSRSVGYWIVPVRPDEFRYDPSLPRATATGGAPLPVQPPVATNPP
ncbi:MAG: SH3 domain-containing protein [Anaerolinea sp.]